MPDYVGPALRSLSGTLQRGFEGIGESRLKESEYGLKRAELMERIRERQEEAPLKALNLLKSVRETKVLAKDEEPFYVSEMVNSQIPTGLPTDVTFDLKTWAAKQIPGVGKIAFGSDIETEKVGGRIAYFRMTSEGKEYITNSDMKEKQNQERLSGAIASVTSRRRFLETLAKANDPQAVALLEGFNKDPVAGLEYELQQKMAVRDYWQAAGYPAENLNKGIEFTAKELEKARSEKLAESKLQEQRVYTEGREEIKKGQPKPTEAERFTDELGNEWKQRMVFKDGKYEPTGAVRLAKPNMTVQQAEKRILDIKKSIFDVSKATSLDTINAWMTVINPSYTKKSIGTEKGPDFETLRKDYINEATSHIRELQRFVNQKKGVTTNGKPSGTKAITLPGTIKTTSQAVDYLMKSHGKTRDEAIEWLRSQ